MSRLRGLRSRRRCGAPQRKLASGRCLTQRRIAIGRTLARQLSGWIEQSPNYRKGSVGSSPHRISVARWPRSQKRRRGFGAIRWLLRLVCKATARSPRKKGKCGAGRRPSPGSACFPPERLSQPADRKHHRAPSGTTPSSVRLLSQLLCRSARIWLCAELSLFMGTTRTWGV